jgi:hypothetical protein
MTEPTNVIPLPRRCQYPGCTERTRPGVWPEHYCGGIHEALHQIEIDQRSIVDMMHAIVKPGIGF